MTTRTTTATVIFTRPFVLNGFDGEQRAGSYLVEIDEELLDGVSFPAYRRTETRMSLDRGSNSGHGAIQIAVVDPKELEAALVVDVAHTLAHDEFAAWRTPNTPGASDGKR
ncbi:MAG TPA: hypothetical protein VFE34_09695 [Dongiaceae bacterium]|jgi:hypothetical protein|nr:hypothetical protein [Dongiaceae bacterium]